MRKDITAKWARETAESVLSVKANAQLEECLKEIESEVAKNELHCTLFFNPENIVIYDLESRGFKVNVNEIHNQMDGPSFTISW